MSTTLLVPEVLLLKSWRTLKSLRASNAAFLEDKDGNTSALARYSTTGLVHNFITQEPMEVSGIPPSASSHFICALFMYARCLVLRQQLYDVKDQDYVIWRQAVLCVELGDLLNFKTETAFPARFGRNLRMMSIEQAAWIGLAAGMGAVEVVNRWAPLLVQAVRNGYILEYNQCGMHHFILRLWCAAHGQDYPQTGYPTYDVSEGILRIWDTPDTEQLAAWLVQLCNQHTQLSRPKQFMDFVSNFSHVPVEVFMLFRLREQRGLPNPEVDHPLMKFPWSALQPVQQAEPDELLSGIYRRLEQDEGITVTGLYAEFLEQN